MPVDPETATLEFEAARPEVHHVATEADIREVLRRLPRGSFDGLGPVRLRCRPADEWYEGTAMDPYIGRNGRECVPDVWAAATRGCYDERDRSVELYAHVYAGEPPAPFGVYLKLRGLATLALELARHHDFTFRTRGDRWLGDHDGSHEDYLRARALALVERCVVPALEARYPAECAAFRRWEAEHTGHAMPLAAYTDDTGDSCPGAALERLARVLARGGDPWDARAGYAMALLDRPDDAHAVLAPVLAAHPEHPRAHRAKAWLAYIDVRFDDAERHCRVALRDGPHDGDEHLLARVLTSQARWDAVVAATTDTLTRPGTPERDLALLALRARAHLALEDRDAVLADVAALRGFRGYHGELAADLVDALRLTRDGAWTLAFVTARRILHRSRLDLLQETEATAVLLESALRLGRPTYSIRFDDDDVLLLRRCGHDPWMDRLVALRS